MDHSAAKGKGVFRIRDWWSKAALLMGMIYLFTACFHIPFEKFIPLSILSLTTICGFASMGYLLNDLFDIEKDALAGKKNFVAGKPLSVILLFFCISAIFVLAPWVFLPKTELSFALIAAQLVLFAVYSIPPIRLKERGLAGIITDALYAHGLPTFLAAYTFALAGGSALLLPDIFILFVWQTIAGVRNIILHQADDLEADGRSGGKNFVSGISAPKFYTTLKWLTAVELLLGLAFFTALLPGNLLFAFCILAVIVLTIVDFSVFTEKDHNRFLSSKQKFFPNNIYEKWLPVVYLSLLATGDRRFAGILIIHIAVFNFDFYVQAAYKLYNSCKGFLISVRIFLSYPVNYFIYYLFRIFGIDLRKENISAITYLRKQLNGKRG